MVSITAQAERKTITITTKVKSNTKYERITKKVLKKSILLPSFVGGSHCKAERNANELLASLDRVQKRKRGMKGAKGKGATTQYGRSKQ